MASDGIEIGDFVPLIEGAEVAELSGQTVDLVVGRLGNRPPFRSPEEVIDLSLDDAIEARRLAVYVSGAAAMALKVGEIDSETSHVIISKSGALAVRASGYKAVLECQELTWILDGGNRSVLLTTHPVEIG